MFLVVLLLVSGSDRARHFNTLITVWLVLLCSLVSFIMQYISWYVIKLILAVFPRKDSLK